jgi:hypothetical protein
MAFPDAEHAIVDPAKVCEYLLNPGHPVGGPKSHWFESIGYTLDNWRKLSEDLLRVARTCDDFTAKASPYGVKYETLGMIGCEGYRPALVLAVWIVEGNSPPRLVTAYPGDG